MEWNPPPFFPPNESMGNDTDKKKLDQRRKKVKSYGLAKSYRT